MSSLSSTDLDAVAGGQEGKSFAQNFVRCVKDTAMGAAAGSAIGGPVAGIVIAVFANLSSDACNALPKPY